METKDISIGSEYFMYTVKGLKLVKVIDFVIGLGFYVKNPDGECFWADAEELEEV